MILPRCVRERGFAFTHETVRDWEARFAPLIGDQLRRKRRGQVSTSWHVDETYGHACKESGATCIVPLIMMATWLTRCSRAKRNMDAAQRFFQQALETVGHAPERVTTYGHASYPRAIRETLGGEVLHQSNHYLNNLIEQDHRGIKQRYYPIRGFGSFTSAARFCRAFDEVRQFFRFRTTIRQPVSLARAS